MQQVEPVCRTLKPPRGPDDPNVVPHESPQFVPIVGDHHKFVGV